MPSAGSGFPWQLLASPDPDAAARAAHPFDTQYWRANVNPSERYSQSLPGSAAFRISPLDDSYDNFTVAGDWTDCGFNAGCVEAAVISGRLAAHALSGAPSLDEIVGYDHP
jgi:predicted NAD/FAD-dependent oxidoreductase